MPIFQIQLLVSDQVQNSGGGIPYLRCAGLLVLPYVLLWSHQADWSLCHYDLQDGVIKTR